MTINMVLINGIYAGINIRCGRWTLDDLNEVLAAKREK